MNVDWSLSLISDMDETGGHLTDIAVQVLENGRMDTSHLGNQGEIRVKSAWALGWTNWRWDRFFYFFGFTLSVSFY
jgi:hypothetical protein